MPEVMYVVGEVGFEYNDEIYTQSSDQAVTPVVVYRSEERAWEVAYQMTIDAILAKQIDLGQYGYDIGEIIEDFDTFRDLVERYKPGFYESFYDEPYSREDEIAMIVSLMNQEERTQFIESLGFSLYTVYEVEVGDE